MFEIPSSGMSSKISLVKSGRSRIVTSPFLGGHTIAPEELIGLLEPTLARSRLIADELSGIEVDAAGLAILWGVTEALVRSSRLRECFNDRDVDGSHLPPKRIW